MKRKWRCAATKFSTFLDKRHAAMSRDALKSINARQYNLGTYISSRPENFTSDDLFHSRPQSMYSQTSGSSVMHLRPRPLSSTGPAQSQQSATGYVPDGWPLSGKMVSFQFAQSFREQPLPSLPRYQSRDYSVNRRLSDPSHRRNTPRKASLLRKSSLPANDVEDHDNGKEVKEVEIFAELEGGDSSPTSSHLAETDAALKQRIRRVSVPVTRQDHADLRKYFEIYRPLPLTQLSTAQVVFNSDQLGAPSTHYNRWVAALPPGFEARPGSENNAPVTSPIKREDAKRPTANYHQHGWNLIPCFCLRR